ncbi:dipeptide/oligopeptide/nickel ABC transporter permease/ATP-binding protein [Microbacterium sp. KSW4-16]|uniref:dipeptide/oligopeptide/nickel ABC transporter permease/ATP-binding protein n=1 Tax=Microbacterium TaxID=33882 RepID=UPI00103D4382|nr:MULTISPECIES: dipeptide/oligopeptide/nickel ABC transporter permease/ATP-binding protein [Microbacterium]MCK8467876.1 dipeptide/oligopeptide/nickel ABC transporter permease/ATP-binding protein [Microbacterium aurugineum]TCJ22528.1 dipeptide/oligopeptide/nickel ABC transporter permease/ATP-binding protein [Microbacterium sp. PI-1]
MRRKLTERLSVPGLRWGRLSLGSIICIAVLAIIGLAAIFAPLISPFDPLASGTPVQPPSAEHWFGTDRQGRDIFSRLVYGARYSLVIGIGATLVALLAACVLGTIAATAPKWISETLMRVMDVIMSFPGIALAAVFVAVFGKSLPVLVLTIAFLYVPQLTRIVRANILDQYGEDYVSAVRVMGSGTPRIIVRHVARNAMAPVLVFATVLVADAIVFEASLSFLQAGVPDPEPSWGNVIAAGRNLLMSGAWWATFFPGILIMLTVLCLNILSEGMTDAMVSPRARKITTDAANTEESTHELEVAAVPDDTHVIPTVDTAVNLSVPSGVPDALVPRAEAVPLAERLTELRLREFSRTDRLVYTGDDRPLLDVQDLCISFPRHGDVDVVDHVSFTVRPGETMSLVGESGCGKSITSLAIMGLLDPKADIRGRILFDGEDLLQMAPKERNALRGHDIAMVYQDALSSLNPAMLIRSQMKQLTSRGGTRTAAELLELVGLDPDRTLASYPHELSGGQRQRVLIAMALTRDPRLVIADEPTTALDVTVQAQVVELLMRLQKELGFALLFVSHDLALVAELTHRITVMYAGQVVEQGTTREVLTQPVHEYTQGLLGAVLSIEAGSDRLHQVSGVVPSPRDFPAGDRFAPRSSDPLRYAGVTPVRRHIEGTEHYYSAHPDDAPVQAIGAGR